MFLRQSTASQEVLLGPFVSDSDGNTAQTALGIAASDIKLFKHGATSEASKNSGGATHISGGRYYAVLDATDTNTLGNLEINVHVSGALPVRREFVVLSANVYDAMITNGVIDATLFGQSAADKIWNTSSRTLTSASGITSSGIQIPISNSLVACNVKNIDDDATAAVNAEAFFDGTGYSGANNTIGTVTTLTNKTGFSLSGTQTFDLTGNITGNLSGSVGSVTGAVGSVTGDVGGKIIGGGAGTITGIGAWAAGASGGALLLNSAYTAPDNTNIGNIHTIVGSAAHGNAALKALIDTVDTVADAVKAKTDQMVFTVANQLDVNALGFAGTAVASSDIGLAGTRLLTMLVLDGAVYRYTANALELAPAGGGGSGDTVNVTIKGDTLRAS